MRYATHRDFALHEFAHLAARAKCVACTAAQNGAGKKDMKRTHAIALNAGG
jgi:hypothetical protein